jgi:hypothetical protein
MTINLVEGWTAPIDYTLKADGVAVNVTGCTVVLKLRDRHGTAIALAGTLAVVSASAGHVAYSPGAAELLFASSPYSARFQVTDSGGKIAYFPNGGTPEQWKVERA